MAKEKTETYIKEGLNDNPFPIESTDPKLKEKPEFGKKIAKYIYFKGMMQDLTTKRRTNAQENRDFASNRNDINKFKTRLDAALDNKGDTSYINIDWSNQHPGKKFVDTIIGGMINQDHKIQFNAIDKNSLKRYTEKRDEFYGKIVRRRDVAEMEAQSGLTLDSKAEFEPSSKEDVDIYMDMEFKQAVEIGMEQIVDFELNNNYWHKKVKKRVIRDLVENNIGAVRLYFDKNNELKMRYVDAPLNLYTSYTDEPDYSDTEYEAERAFMSIRQLRRLDYKNEISERQWFKIAKESKGVNSNPEWKFGENYSPTKEYNGTAYSYDDFRVEVLDFVHYSIDRYDYAESVDNYGNMRMERKDHGYANRKKSKKVKEVHPIEIEGQYEGVWVVDSDIIVGYGRARNIIRPKKEGKELVPRCLHRYVVFQPNLKNGTSTSMVDVMRPILEAIQLLVLKKRHYIAEMPVSGAAVDATGIRDVLAALGETDPMKIVKIYKQKGVLFYSRTDVNGDPANGLPVQELNHPFAEQLAGLDSSILAEIEQLRQVTGINEVRDGSAPDKNALVGIEKMRLLASNNTTRELYQGYLDGILAPIGEVMSRMVQYKVEYGGGIQVYENIIGEIATKELSFAEDITMAQMGIVIEALPTDDQIQDLIDMLTVSLKAKEIRPEDVLEIKRIRNIKKAERLLVYRRKRYAEEKLLEFQRQEQATGEREQRSAMAAAEAEKIKLAAKAESEKAVLEKEYQLKKELEETKGRNKLSEINQEGYWNEKLLNRQLEETDGEGDAIDKPKIFRNPAEAVSRTTEQPTP